MNAMAGVQGAGGYGRGCVRRFQPGGSQLITPTPNKDINYVFVTLFAAVDNPPTEPSFRANLTCTISRSAVSTLARPPAYPI